MHDEIEKLDRPEEMGKSVTPNISLLISAYNEEKVIADKLFNSLSLDYPRDRLQIVVVSDGSVDRTDDIVKSFQKEGIVLRRYEGRLGKTKCLNEAVPLCSGDIVVFSDANSKLDPRAIRHLIRKFADPQVGLVTGSTKYTSKNNNHITDSVGFYSKIEKATKILESQTGSCVGADGAIFAIRKKLFQPLRAHDINDFVIPLNIVRQGYRAVIAEDAFCTEETTEGISGEFERQTRITSRTLRAIFSNFDMLNPFKHGIFSFNLVSHKIFKFLVPYFMLLLLLSNLCLAFYHILYAFILIGQITLYMLAVLGYWERFTAKGPKIVEVAQTFISVNIAIFWGWMLFFRGKTYTTWSSSR
jgi:cellulose synthase/poly-beta-1,6-N-acetylglucosamine synthase-like glycosyltransferase